MTSKLSSNVEMKQKQNFKQIKIGDNFFIFFLKTQSKLMITKKYF